MIVHVSFETAFYSTESEYCYPHFVQQLARNDF